MVPASPFDWHSSPGSLTKAARFFLTSIGVRDTFAETLTGYRPVLGWRGTL
jgi:hypothetical protein